jgi:hypothetical protein
MSLRQLVVRHSAFVRNYHDMAYRCEEHTKSRGVDAGAQRSLWHKRIIQESLVRNLESTSDWNHLPVDV